MFDELPAEILRAILSNLPFKNIFLLRGVCKLLNLSIADTENYLNHLELMVSGAEFQIVTAAQIRPSALEFLSADDFSRIAQQYIEHVQGNDNLTNMVLSRKTCDTKLVQSRTWKSLTIMDGTALTMVDLQGFNGLLQVRCAATAQQLQLIAAMNPNVKFSSIQEVVLSTSADVATMCGVLKTCGAKCTAIGITLSSFQGKEDEIVTVLNESLPACRSILIKDESASKHLTFAGLRCSALYLDGSNMKVTDALVSEIIFPPLLVAKTASKTTPSLLNVSQAAPAELIVETRNISTIAWTAHTLAVSLWLQSILIIITSVDGALQRVQLLPQQPISVTGVDQVTCEIPACSDYQLNTNAAKCVTLDLCSIPLDQLEQLDQLDQLEQLVEVMLYTSRLDGVDINVINPHGFRTSVTVHGPEGMVVWHVSS